MASANPSAATAKNGRLFNFQMSLPEQYDGNLCKTEFSISKTVAAIGETIEVSWKCMPEG